MFHNTFFTLCLLLAFQLPAFLMIIQKKIPLILLECNDFPYFEFFLHLLYCMCTLSVSELISCYLKILSSCLQLIQLKSLNTVEVLSSSFAYLIWNKKSLQGLKNVSQARIKKLVWFSLQFPFCCIKEKNWHKDPNKLLIHAFQ